MYNGGQRPNSWQAFANEQWCEGPQLRCHPSEFDSWCMGQKLVRYSLIPAIQLSSYLKSKFVSLTGTSLMTSDLAICQTECDIGMRIAMVQVCYPLLLSKQQTNMVQSCCNWLSDKILCPQNHDCKNLLTKKRSTFQAFVDSLDL